MVFQYDQRAISRPAKLELSPLPLAYTIITVIDGQAQTIHTWISETPSGSVARLRRVRHAWEMLRRHPHWRPELKVIQEHQTGQDPSL